MNQLLCWVETQTLLDFGRKALGDESDVMFDQDELLVRGLREEQPL